MTSKACKLHMLINNERNVLEKGKVSTFGEFRRTCITRNTCIRFVKHPKQQRLVDCYDYFFHANPKNEEPESFPPKKDHSYKTFKQSSSSVFDNFVALDS